MLGQLIKERMAELGMRQADVARRSNLSRQYISDLVAEKRGRNLSIRTQQALARALRVSAARVAASVASADELSAKADSEGSHANHLG